MFAVLFTISFVFLSDEQRLLLELLFWFVHWIATQISYRNYALQTVFNWGEPLPCSFPPTSLTRVVMQSQRLQDPVPPACFPGSHSPKEWREPWDSRNIWVFLAAPGWAGNEHQADKISSADHLWITGHFPNIFHKVTVVSGVGWPRELKDTVLTRDHWSHID